MWPVGVGACVLARGCVCVWITLPDYIDFLNTCLSFTATPSRSVREGSQCSTGSHY